jgi:adenylate kinase
MLRAEVKSGTALGNEIQQQVHNGQLVSDSLVIKLVKDRLSQSDATKGWLLDGYPRTEAQAEMLSSVAPPDFATHIYMERWAAIRKVTGRRLCATCGSSFNIEDIREGGFDMPGEGRFFSADAATSDCNASRRLLPSNSAEFR